MNFTCRTGPPEQVETFEFSTDRELDAKFRDVVGLSMAPPEGSIAGRALKAPVIACPADL